MSRTYCWLTTLMLLGPVSPVCAQLPSSNTVITQLRNEYKAADNDSSQAWIAKKLAIRYYMMSHDSACYFANLSIKLARKVPDKHLLVDAYRRLGQAYEATNQSAKSLAILTKAEQLSKQILKDTMTALIQETLAVTYLAQGNNDKAMVKYLQALRYYETNHISKYAGRVYSNLGAIQINMKSYRQALLYLNKAKEIAIQDHNLYTELLSLNNIATVLYELGQNHKAKQTSWQALRLAHTIKNVWLETESLVLIGKLMNDSHHYQQAIAYSQQGLLLQQRQQDKTHIARLHINLANSYVGLTQYKRAVRHVNVAVAMLRSITYVEELRKALVVQVKVLEKAAYYKWALTVFKELQVLTDSITGLEKTKEVSRIQASFDIESKQNLINQQQQQLTFARQRQFYYLVIVCLLIGLLVLIVFLFRRQQTARRLLTQQKEEIQLQAQQLTDLNATKDKLFSLISHDLRSPLASLKLGFHQLTGLTAFASAPLVQTAHQLEGQVDRVLELLSNLLDWSHAQMTGFHVLLQPINLTQSMLEEINQVSELLQRKQITLLNQMGQTNEVVADRDQLSAVLRNVLTNAIKFTPAGGYIRLSTVQLAGRLELQVRDTGIGMNAAQLKSLFEQPQVRVGTGGERGSGLGLQICREMLARQGGSLVVQSEEHAGTTVKIQLPIQ